VKLDDGRSKADPYVRFKYGRKKYTTRVQKDTYHPVFEEEFSIPDFNINDKITVTIYDNDRFKDDYVGEFYIYPKKVLESGMNGHFVEYAFGPDKDYLVVRLSWTDKWK
jgi:Ca2+-dependent lipid-binding protein